MWSGHASPRWFPLPSLRTAFFMFSITSSLIVLFSGTLARIPRGIHTANWNVLCGLLHFSSRVKPPCSFVMAAVKPSPLEHGGFFAHAFLPAPGSTGELKPKRSKKSQYQKRYWLFLKTAEPYISITPIFYSYKGYFLHKASTPRRISSAFSAKLSIAAAMNPAI